MVRTVEGHLLTMARPLAESFGLAPVQLGACQCCNEYPSDPHRGRIYALGSDVKQLQILSELRDGHTHIHQV